MADPQDQPQQYKSFDLPQNAPGPDSAHVYNQPGVTITGEMQSGVTNGMEWTRFQYGNKMLKLSNKYLN